jgi:hypothetical protein
MGFVGSASKRVLELACGGSIIFHEDSHGPDGQHKIHEDLLLQLLYIGRLLAGSPCGVHDVISLCDFILCRVDGVIGMTAIEPGAPY